MRNVLTAYLNGLDFADALHLGQISRVSQPRFATTEALASDFEKAHYT